MSQVNESWHTYERHSILPSVFASAGTSRCICRRYVHTSHVVSADMTRICRYDSASAADMCIRVMPADTSHVCSCSVLQCSVLQCVAVQIRVMSAVVVCCSAVCCSALQCVAVQIRVCCRHDCCRYVRHDSFMCDMTHSCVT